MTRITGCHRPHRTRKTILRICLPSCGITSHPSQPALSQSPRAGTRVPRLNRQILASNGHMNSRREVSRSHPRSSFRLHGLHQSHSTGAPACCKHLIRYATPHQRICCAGADASVRGNDDNDDEEDLYNATPPGSPRQIMRKPAATVRSVSGSSGFTTTTSTSGAAGPVHAGTPSASPRQAASAVPRIQTTLVGTSPQSNHLPSLDLEIPIPDADGQHNVVHASVRYKSAPGRISNSQTWPTQPASHGAPAVLPSGYPYSAPPTSLNANDMIAQSYPPPPRPEQLASLGRRDDQPANPNRLSGGFQVAGCPSEAGTQAFLGRPAAAIPAGPSLAAESSTCTTETAASPRCASPVAHRRPTADH